MCRMLFVSGLVGWLCLAEVSSADAQPGKGAGRGPGIGRPGGRPVTPNANGPGAPGRAPAGPPQARGTKPEAEPGANARPAFAGQRPAGRDEADGVGRLNPQDRQATANKLREIADRNGNQNLRDAARRREQRGRDQRGQRDLDDDVARDLDDRRADENERQAERAAEQAEARQEAAEREAERQREGEGPDNGGLANAERQLQQQLEVAQKLRELAAKNGNENLIRTAERMESMAANRYEQQLRRLAP